MSTKFRIFCLQLSNGNVLRQSLLFGKPIANRCSKISCSGNPQYNQLPIQKAYFSTSIKNFQSSDNTNSNNQGKVDFVNGLVKVTLKLPARGELCEFNLKLLNDTINTLIENLYTEDKSIEKAQVFTQDGVRLAKNTPISAIVLEPFSIKINDSIYNFEPPSSLAKDTTGSIDVQSNDDLEEIKKLVSKLYLHLNVETFETKREQEIVKELEILKLELEPMEQKRNELSLKAKKHTNRMVWLGLGLMGIQAGVMARLTWFDYSWDIVEPISYFVSYSAVVGTYAYFVLTRKEYDYASATDRIFLRNFHKNAAKYDMDISKYNEMKNTVFKLESDLRRIKTSQLKNYDENKA